MNEHFETALRREGFDIARQSMPAGAVVAEHVHPFDVRALVLNGEIRLTVEGEDIFVLPAGHRHAEAAGPTGVDYLVGRRQAGDVSTNDEPRTS